jgi:hypothetical protein
MKLNLNIDTSAIDRMAEGLAKKIKKAVGKTLSKEGKELVKDIRRHVAARMKINRPAFLQNFRVRVLEGGQRFPALWVYSRSKWAGAFEHGITIHGKMLIPINGRVGRQRFKAYVDALMRSGNAFFIKRNGKVILMAENIQENAKPLAGFKRRYRKASGIKRLKRGAEIPIAILVPKVTIPKRLDVEGVVRGRLPRLREGIQREIAALVKA